MYSSELRCDIRFVFKRRRDRRNVCVQFPDQPQGACKCSRIHHNPHRVWRHADQQCHVHHYSSIACLLPNQHAIKSLDLPQWLHSGCQFHIHSHLGWPPESQYGRDRPVVHCDDILYQQHIPGPEDLRELHQCAQHRCQGHTFMWLQYNCGLLQHCLQCHLQLSDQLHRCHQAKQCAVYQTADCLRCLEPFRQYYVLVV